MKDVDPELMHKKPCPFCGECAELQEDAFSYWVECSGCLARGPESTVDDDGYEAIEDWNRRTL